MKHWTEREKALLARLLSHKMKAEEIARIIGRSRSAIIGQVNRNAVLRALGFQHDRMRTGKANSIEDGQ